MRRRASPRSSRSSRSRAVARFGIAALLLGLAGLPSFARAETILFVGNSFTAGAGSVVERFRPGTVTDLNGDGTGGIPALFKSFAGQSGLAWDVNLEVAGGMNLDYHHDEKAAIIARPWDQVVLQGYSTLDPDAPGNAGKIVDYSARLARLAREANPRAVVRLFATWSRADQTYPESGHWFGKPIEQMALDVRAAYDEAAAQSPDICAVIPVGEAWNRAIAQGVAVRDPFAGAAGDAVNLWADDGYHASAYGSYLAALVVFGSVTGRDPRDLGGGEEAAGEMGIAPATAVALQRIASETLAREPAACLSERRRRSAS